MLNLVGERDRRRGAPQILLGFPAPEMSEHHDVSGDLEAAVSSRFEPGPENRDQPLPHAGPQRADQLRVRPSQANQRAQAVDRKDVEERTLLGFHRPIEDVLYSLLAI